MKTSSLGLSLATISLLVLAVGCRASTRDTTEADPAPATPPATSAAEDPEPAAEDPEPAPVKPAPVQGAVGVQRALIPPAVEGQNVSRIEGCLAQGAGDDGDGVRFPVLTPTRGGDAKAKATRVSTTGTGVLITHELSHACCLKAKVHSVVERTYSRYQTVHVSVVLSGEPCRCMCSSTVQAAVGLQPDTYILAVEVADGESLETVHQSQITVGAKSGD